MTRRQRDLEPRCSRPPRAAAGRGERGRDCTAEGKEGGTVSNDRRERGRGCNDRRERGRSCAACGRAPSSSHLRARSCAGPIPHVRSIRLVRKLRYCGRCAIAAGAQLRQARNCGRCAIAAGALLRQVRFCAIPMRSSRIRVARAARAHYCTCCTRALLHLRYSVTRNCGESCRRQAAGCPCAAGLMPRRVAGQAQPCGEDGRSSRG